MSSEVVVENRRPAIFVTGTGRSGTSLTTELLGRIGIDLGPHDRMLPPVSDDNARGYFEQTAIYEINEQIFALFGGTWERPPRFELGWHHAPELAPLRRTAAVTLLALYGPAPRRYAIKDPRLAVTLPFWLELTGPGDHILCFRHPADVARSLIRRERHGLDDHDAIDLWIRYTRDSLATTDGRERLLLSYEAYFEDTDAQLERLVEFVLGPGGADDPSLMAALRECVDPDLWHHRERTLPADAVALSEEAAELYAGLLREAGLAFERDEAPSGVRADR